MFEPKTKKNFAYFRLIKEFPLSKNTPLQKLYLKKKFLKVQAK